MNRAHVAAASGARARTRDGTASPRLAAGCGGASDCDRSVRQAGWPIGCTTHPATPASRARRQAAVAARQSMGADLRSGAPPLACQAATALLKSPLCQAAVLARSTHCLARG